MPISREDLEDTIAIAFPDAIINITALANDNDHWAVEIIDPVFKGHSRIAQHKMVQAAIKHRDIHALQITTKVVG